MQLWLAKAWGVYLSLVHSVDRCSSSSSFTCE